MKKGVGLDKSPALNDPGVICRNCGRKLVGFGIGRRKSLVGSYGRSRSGPEVPTAKVMTQGMQIVAAMAWHQSGLWIG